MLEVSPKVQVISEICPPVVTGPKWDDPAYCTNNFGRNGRALLIQSLNSNFERLNSYFESLKSYFESLNSYFQSLNSYFQSLNSYFQSLNLYFETVADS